MNLGEKMKAVGYSHFNEGQESGSLVDIQLDKPVAIGRDLLIKVDAVSVNPVDTKIRSRVNPKPNEHQVLGWDAVGTVEAVGEDVSLFNVGDKVWYAGAIDRAGSNAEYHLVDERIVAKKPVNITDSEAAALPLTTITAWEMLFERFKFSAKSTGTLLVVGGAGGVGSILIQLAKQLTNLTVIATASRKETIYWVKNMGADFVINHRHALDAELSQIGFDHVDNIAALTATDHYAEVYPEIIAPQGQLALIDDPHTFDIMPFKKKSVSIHWEFMYTRSLFQTDDMIEQHRLLAKTAELVEQGKIKTTLHSQLGEINAANLRQAHALVESGKSVGKIVLSGF
jgi:zinc-binding alcohol dehydrogenase family protein